MLNVLLAAKDDDFLAKNWHWILFVIIGILFLVFLVIFFSFVKLWIKSLLAGAKIGLLDMIRMKLLGIPYDVVVEQKVALVQAGVKASTQELEELRGQFGQALSSLRPAGVVDFNGRRIDCITEGIMVEPGQWVRCIEVKTGKVLVRPVEKPDIGGLETADFG